MERMCYDCGTDLTLDEAVKGQEWLDWCNLYPDGDFEGWVHCTGEDVQFIQEADTELIEACNKLPLSDRASYEGSIIVCVACAKSQFQIETGIQFKRGEEDWGGVKLNIDVNKAFMTGDVVKFTGDSGDQWKWGNNTNPENVLVVGQTYIVTDVEVHGWHTKLSLRNEPGQFNSVSFEKVNEKDL